MIPKYLMKSKEMRALLEFAIHNEVITENQCFQFYASSQRLKDALRYLMANNLLKQIDNDVYKFIPEEERINNDIYESLKKDNDNKKGEI